MNMRIPQRYKKCRFNRSNLLIATFVSVKILKDVLNSQPPKSFVQGGDAQGPKSFVQGGDAQGPKSFVQGGDAQG